MDITQSPISLLIFIIVLALSLYTLFFNGKLLDKLILSPYDLARDKSNWYQIFTSSLVHNDLAHLSFNILTFYFFAFGLEEQVGSPAFLSIYLTSLVASTIPTIIKEKNNPNYLTLGASGAISGILFSFILLNPSIKMYLFFIPIPIPAPLFAIFFIIYSSFGEKKFNDGINHSAHLYGALTGILVTFFLYPSSFSNFVHSIIHIFN